MSRKRRNKAVSTDNAVAVQERTVQKRTASPTAHWIRFWPIIVTLVGAIIRVAYELQFTRTPLAHHLFLDSALYDQWANDIVAGRTFDDHRPYFIEPGYAYLLALLKIAHTGAIGIRVIQSIMGIATAVLAGLIAQRLAGDRAALVAGVLTASYMPLVFFEGLELKTTIEVFTNILVIAIAMLAVHRPTPLTAVGFGLLAGSFAFVRSNVLAVVVVIAVYSWWILRKQPAAAALYAALFLVFAAVTPIGMAARNGVVSGEWQAMPTNSGLNFYEGNSLYSNGYFIHTPFMRYEPFTEEDASINEASRRLGHSATPVETSQFWWHQTWSEIGQDPGRWIGLMFTKVKLYFNYFEVTDDVSIYFVARFVPMLGWLLPGFWLAAPLGLAGAFYAFRRSSPEWLLIAASIVVLVAGIVVFHVADRYRIPAAPLMIALGVAAITEALEATVAGVRRPGMGAILAGAAIGIVLVALPSIGQNMSGQYTLLAAATSNAGNGDAAIDAFQAAVQAEPTAPQNYYNLAVALLRYRHDQTNAEADLRKAISLNASYGDAYSALASLLSDTGRFSEAAADYQKAVALGFNPAASYFGAAAAFGNLQQFDQSQAMVEAGLKLDPKNANGLQLLGNLLYVRRDIAGARSAWQESLAVQPNNPALVKDLATLPSK